jgi:hypothetical protein
VNEASIFIDNSTDVSFSDIEARKATVEREYHEAEQKSKSVNSRYNAIKREQEQLHVRKKNP